MTKSHSGMKTAAGMLPKVRPVVDEPEAERTTSDSRGYKRQTFYLPPIIHDQFRDLSHAKRCSQQELFRRAANLLFAQEGLPSWGDLEPPKKRTA